jgi:hypothetical protein
VLTLVPAGRPFTGEFTVLRFDHEIATILWVAALVAVYLIPSHPDIGLGLVIATSVNLLSRRWIAFNAGAEFETKVRAVLAANWLPIESRTALMETKTKDIVESQIKIAGAFRGRNRP